MKLRILLLSIIVLWCSDLLYGQYYILGQDPIYLKWRSIESGSGKVIFPSYMDSTARAVTGYKQFLTPHITAGLTDKIDNFPIILHSTALESNGMVSWAPKRMELYSSPPTDNYALSWMKQLTAHEYRHVVQMSNLNVGFTRALRYILGESAVGLVTALAPTWLYEGDAVLAETRFAMFGRGRQPEYNIEYRALLAEMEPEDFNLTKIIRGSIKDNVPNAYELGYLLVPSAIYHYGENFWGDVLEYTGKYPFLLFSPNLAYKKFYGTTLGQMKDTTFTHLKRVWHEASLVDNSSTFINTPYTSYTTYGSPVAFGKSFVATKSDRDRSSRIVMVDSLAGEKILTGTGTISSRINRLGDRLFWTEYTPSRSWSLKSSSDVRYMDIDTLAKRPSKAKSLIKGRSIFFFTPMAERGYAFIEYDKYSMPSVVVCDRALVERSRVALSSSGASVNGLAWDERSQTLAMIFLDDRGMRLSRVNIASGAIEDITEPSYVTRKDLSANDGKLYFTSIASGKDEVHSYDLLTGLEHQITTSKFGSFAGTAEDSTLVMMTYKRDGYFLAKQTINSDSLKRVEQRMMPEDPLDPGFIDWDAWAKLDTLNLALAVDTAAMSSKRFSKSAHAVNPHSWMPVAIDIDELVYEHRIDIGLGGMVMSQNLLGTVVSTIGYYYDFKKQMNMVEGDVSYTALPVHFTLAGVYGDGYQSTYAYRESPTDAGSSSAAANLSLVASLPLDLDLRGFQRNVTPYVGLNYYNDILLDETDNYETGLWKLSAGVTLQKYTNMATKELNPRYGYILDLSTTINPFSKIFGKIVNLYGSFYLPGIARLHSTNIKADFQYQSTGYYNFNQKKLFPQGVDYNVSPNYLYSTGAYYKFPVAYPDGGIPSLLYIKRIYMNLYGEYAHIRYYDQDTYHRSNPYTYGGDLMFDFNIMRIGVEFNAGVSVYKPSDKGVMAGVIFNFAL